ncbi:hypothetical protein [Halobacteriovorax sp. HLS]|uniref:hypothetical protein n=1 Tax=Halobacteriovorax sp. HLS TaxID=2234000 RepID=UPI000FDAE4FA|nr:hypothetical protein [Halobacteriovorax sp. HLS]
MCDVCKAENLDSDFMNGARNKNNASKLYRVFKGQVAVVKTCPLHDIQLFMLGEQKFLLENLSFLKFLNQNRRSFISNSF